MSPDEQVAVDALTGASGMPAPDLAVVVLDATALSRSLYLLSMVVELGLPTVVALTMNDLAFRNGRGIDTERLSRLLDGMPVVAVDGRTGDGAKALADAITAGFREPPFPMGWPHGPASRPMPMGAPPMTCAPGLNHGPMPALTGPPAYCVASTSTTTAMSPCSTASTACCCTP